ncbi:MAG: hypothetical protein GC131_07200 [Alphaproteobacteria bacterium]|nr:hypothetical protein [Alphaproteobacteria bacterium]
MFSKLSGGLGKAGYIFTQFGLAATVMLSATLMPPLITAALLAGYIGWAAYGSYRYYQTERQEEGRSRFGAAARITLMHAATFALIAATALGVLHMGALGGIGFPLIKGFMHACMYGSLAAMPAPLLYGGYHALAKTPDAPRGWQ